MRGPNPLSDSLGRWVNGKFSWVWCEQVSLREHRLQGVPKSISKAFDPQIVYDLDTASQWHEMGDVFDFDIMKAAFAFSRCSESEEFLEFGKLYGPLGIEVDERIYGSRVRRGLIGEPLLVLRDVAEDLKTVLGLWYSLSNELFEQCELFEEKCAWGTESLEDYLDLSDADGLWLDLLPVDSRTSRLEPETLILHEIGFICTWYLHSMAVRVEYPTVAKRLRGKSSLLPVPKSLEQAIWAEVCDRVMDGSILGKCARCASWFVCTGRGKSGLPRRHCSPTCKSRAFEENNPGRKRVTQRKQGQR